MRLSDYFIVKTAKDTLNQFWQTKFGFLEESEMNLKYLALRIISFLNPFSVKILRLNLLITKQHN